MYKPQQSLIKEEIEAGMQKDYQIFKMRCKHNGTITVVIQVRKYFIE